MLCVYEINTKGPGLPRSYILTVGTTAQAVGMKFEKSVNSAALKIVSGKI